MGQEVREVLRLLIFIGEYWKSLTAVCEYGKVLQKPRGPGDSRRLHGVQLKRSFLCRIGSKFDPCRFRSPAKV
jgi:hypothetical protein